MGKRVPKEMTNLKHRGGKTKIEDRFKYDYSKDYDGKTWQKEKKNMAKTGWWTLLITPLVICAVIYYFWYMHSLKNSVRTPLNVPTVIEQNGTSAANAPEKFWGTYRSGVYFGLKTRCPNSPVVGLMWMSQFVNQPSIRHWCDQGDGLPMYGWFSHDGVNYGVQQIADDRYILTTDFVKRLGGSHGGDWTARIGVKAKPGAEKQVISLIFYMALDGVGKIEADITSSDHLKAITGYTSDLGHFRMTFPSNPGSKKQYNYLVTHADSLHGIKDVLMERFRTYTWDKSKKSMYYGLGGHLMPRDVKEPNLIVHQITIELPVDIEILFESGSFTNRPNALSGPVYQHELQGHIQAFDGKFEELFELKSKGYKDDEIYFAKAVLSNMLGGIGYFYGSSLVKSIHTNNEPLNYWQTGLYTAVPSRSFFPRGFLWDEGFHNILINKWDVEMSKDIIGHWLDLMNVDGWIPREQILGSESRARVPEEFIVQHNQNANPPTLFLPLQSMVQSLAISGNPSDLDYLRRVFPRLKVWYSWFNTSQTGPLPGTYRWRGRDAVTKRELNPKTLTSGLDDGPRASHPTGEEYHIDLRCWMALASGVMADIASAIGEDSELYQATYDYLTDNTQLDALHWSSKHQYSDYGLHTDKVKLQTPARPPNAQPGQYQAPREKERVTKQEPSLKHVNALGYISLFPFLLKIVDPQSPKLGQILTDLHDPQSLWTEYGIRSLAKNSPLYNKRNTEHDPPYWRGAIWINMNYLTVSALHYYSSVDSPYAKQAAQIYTELRTNLVSNLITQYRNTGYIWEQYNDDTGRGQGSHPFTGWSALIVAIMAEDY